jgi:FkbM family methyltransferase
VNARLVRYARQLLKDELDDVAFLLAKNPPRTIFDCGANVGFVTHRFRELFPTATVYAFEPNPAVYEKLVDTYRDDAKVKTFPMAISKAPATLTFHTNKNTGTSSFFAPTEYNHLHYARRKTTAIEVPVTSIDAIAAKESIEEIDILKLDLEGSEFDALLGAESLLTRQRVKVIYTEVALVPLYEKQPLFEDLVVHLRGKGYHLYNIYGFNESAIRQAVLGNATFISTAFRDQLSATWGAETGW